MPDVYTVNRDGIVVAYHRDRSRSYRFVCDVGDAYGGYVYEGDVHDVVSPARIGPVKRAAQRRREAYLNSLTLCTYCSLDKHSHGYCDCCGPYGNDACDDYTRPQPLVLLEAV